jgi:hypothetical protein
MMGLLGDDIQGNRAEVTLDLSSRGEVTAGCEVVYVSDHDEEYLIGLHFIDFDEAGEKAYQDYIDGLSQKVS